jgi:hypothetical protein
MERSRQPQVCRQAFPHRADANTAALSEMFGRERRGKNRKKRSIEGDNLAEAVSFLSDSCFVLSAIAVSLTYCFFIWLGIALIIGNMV